MEPFLEGQDHYGQSNVQHPCHCLQLPSPALYPHMGTYLLLIPQAPGHRLSSTVDFS